MGSLTRRYHNSRQEGKGRTSDVVLTPAAQMKDVVCKTIGQEQLRSTHCTGFEAVCTLVHSFRQAREPPQPSETS